MARNFKHADCLFFVLVLLVGCDSQQPKPVPKTQHTTSFVVFPADCNANPPMLFGGKILAEMDRCAAITVRKFLYASRVRDYVTVGIADVKFHASGAVKDLINVTGEVSKVGAKSIQVYVRVEKEEIKDGKISLSLLTDGYFTFVAYDVTQKKAVEHGLSLGGK